MTFVINGDGTATLSGTPAAGTAGTYVLTISATNTLDPTQTFTLTVDAGTAMVTAVSPSTGSAAGGTVVTITGSGFTGATGVDFGTVPATSFTVVSNTVITADSPPGSGTVDVTVVTPAGNSPTSPADHFTFNAAAGPTVVSLVRFGFHMQPTTLVLTFSTALDPTSAQNVNNYQIMTSDGALIPVTSAVYNASTMTVTLTPSQLLNIHDVYQLTVTGTLPNGLTSSTGVALDGAGNGANGTNYVTTVSGQNLGGPAPALLQANSKRFAAERRILEAVDRKLATEANYRATERRRLEAAEKKMAAAAQKLAAPEVKGPSTSAVDHVLGSGAVTVKKAIARRHK